MKCLSIRNRTFLARLYQIPILALTVAGISFGFTKAADSDLETRKWVIKSVELKLDGSMNGTLHAYDPERDYIILKAAGREHAYQIASRKSSIPSRSSMCKRFPGIKSQQEQAGQLPRIFSASRLE